MKKVRAKKISVDFDTLKRVIDYLAPEEKRHYGEDYVKSGKHIWLSVRKLKKAIYGSI